MRPLIVFVHIPKAGGTSVNAYLKAHFGPGLPHCEHLLNNPRRFARALERVDWVSGHVVGPRLRKSIMAHSDRPLRMFACVREPLAQVASHYNWIMRLRERSLLRYLRYPRELRHLSRAMREPRNATPEAVVDLMRAHPKLFANRQSRYVDGQQGQVFIPHYEALYPMDALPDMIAHMTGAAPQSVRHSNQSPYRLDQAVFESEPVRRFLAETNGQDAKLYNSLLARSAN